MLTTYIKLMHGHENMDLYNSPIRLHGIFIAKHWDNFVGYALVE
jgi:hypothetical protein